MEDRDGEDDRRRSAGTEYVKRIFLSFDKEGEEEINLQDLPNAIRLCGLAPTETELQELMITADPEGAGKVNYEQFVSAVSACFYSFRSADALREAFRVFDPDSRGTISANDMRYILSSFGDTMSDAEINFFFEECKQELDTEGNVPYDDVIQRLLPDILKQL